MSNEAFAYVPSLRRRLLDFLIPSDPLYPEDWHRDVGPPGDLMTTRVEIHMGWRDRLRVLVTGHVTVETQIQTADAIDVLKSDSVVRAGAIL